jgi:hypothetical protein
MIHTLAAVSGEGKRKEVKDMPGKILQYLVKFLGFRKNAKEAEVEYEG